MDDARRTRVHERLHPSHFPGLLDQIPRSLDVHFVVERPGNLRLSVAGPVGDHCGRRGVDYYLGFDSLEDIADFGGGGDVSGVVGCTREAVVVCA